MWTLYVYALIIFLGLINYLVAKRSGVQSGGSETMAMISGGVWGLAMVSGFFFEGFLFGVANFAAIICLLNIQEQIYSGYWDRLELEEKEAS